MSGWATLAGAGAVVYAARKGASTFTDWRQQKVDERQVEAAERIVTLAYRLRSIFTSVRSRAIFSHEADAAERLLDIEQPEWRNREKASLERLRSAQVLYNRLKEHQSDWNEIWTLRPIALALFGVSLEADLQMLWKQYVSLDVAVSEYAEDGTLDRELVRSMRAEMYGGKEDAITTNVDAAIASIEAILLPVLRRSSTAVAEREA
ncbi:MAG: hypothetical protein V4530_08065 [Pseudomonadota bacterium]